MGCTQFSQAKLNDVESETLGLDREQPLRTICAWLDQFADDRMSQRG